MMNKIIPSVIEDNGEYYIHMEEYKKVKELGEHYKHLYSEVKKQKDDVVEYIKNGDLLYLASKISTVYRDNIEVVAVYDRLKDLLRMLGEIDE